MKLLAKPLLAAAIAAAFQVSGAQLYYQGSMADNYNSGPDSASITSNGGTASIPDGSYVYASSTRRALAASDYSVQEGDFGLASAARWVNDWAISAPSQDTGQTQDGRLWFNLKGQLDATGILGTAYAIVNLIITDNSTGVNVFYDQLDFGNFTGAYGDNYSTIVAVGGFTDFMNASQATGFDSVVSSLANGLDIYTNPIAWTAGDTYSVQLGFDTQALRYETGYTTGPTVALFADPFTFATDRPVVDLPSGWTLNSPQSDIVDDELLPEPPTPVVVGIGLLGLAVFRRRR